MTTRKFNKLKHMTETHIGICKCLIKFNVWLTVYLCGGCLIKKGE